MSADELRAVVEAAVRDASGFTWLTYVLAVVFSMAGAFFGSYIKRKGEDRAAKENFDNLREQVRKTTRDTEEIKTALLRRSWLTQQQWAIREQQYALLLTHLTKLELSLQDRESYYIEPGSEHDENLSKGEHFQALATAGHESYQTIRELIGPASIFLSSRTIDALEKLVRDHWSVSEFSVCTAEYVSEALKLVQAARTAVFEEARNELTQSRPE